MRSSHVVRYSNQRLTIPRPFLELLNLRKSARLYGVMVGEGDKQSLLLSAIPYVHWKDAFRLEVYVDSPIGSLEKVTRVMAERGLDILTCWAASTSSDGELCFQAVVRLPQVMCKTMEARSTSYKEQVASIASSMASDLEGRMRELKCLAGGAMFDSESPLTRVRLVPLLFLGQVAERHGERYVAFNVNECTVSFLEAEDEEGKPFQLLHAAPNKELQQFAVVTADSHECFLRIAQLRPGRYRRISFELSTQGDSAADFCGYMNVVAACCQDLGLNIMLAKTSILETSIRQDATAELLRYSVVCNADKWFQRNPVPKGADARLATAFEDKLDERLKEKAKVSKVKADVRSDQAFPQKTRVAVTEIAYLKPFVFIATNVKVGTKYVDHAVELVRWLKSLGFWPVNVDTSSGQGPLVQEILGLLKLCPFLIAMYVPEPGTKLAPSPPGSRRRVPTYAASDYTMFEEAWMVHSGRNSFRVAHEDVFHARFRDHTTTSTFTDGTWSEAFSRMKKQIELVQQSQDFWRHVDECRELLRQKGDDLHLGRDLEGWLLNQVPHA